MFVKQNNSEAWWTTPTTQYSPKFSSPLWAPQPANATEVWPRKAAESPPKEKEQVSAGASSRAIQLQYTDIQQQIRQCRELETELLQQQEKLVRSILISNRDYGIVSACISPPQRVTSPPEMLPYNDVAPPTREAMLTRLIEGQREDYRRIFVPGRGWISKIKLQDELQVSEVELERMAGISC